MPAPVSLGSMLTAIQQRANIENLVAAAGTFISLPELRGYVNELGSELYDELVQNAHPEWFRKTAIFTTTGNQGAYPLPADIYLLLSVDVFLAPNMVISARPYMESERNMFRWYPGWFYNTPVYFRLLGVPASTGANIQPPMISFIPAPASTYQVGVNYYPPFRTFATDGSEDANIMDGMNGWEGYVIWGATAICLEKLKQNSDYAMNRMAQYKARIESLAADRHAGDAERVHDVSSDNDGLFSVP